MKVSCLQEHLAAGLALVGRVVPTRSTLPIISNILLVAEPGQLRLTATNLDMAIRTQVPARVMQEGKFTLPARLLAEYVGLLDRGSQIDLELNSKAQRVHLRCGRYEANIAGLNADDFPAIPTVSGGDTSSVPAPVLKEAIGQVVFAASDDDSRPVLTGVLLRLHGSQLTLAAADGFRLAVRTVDLESDQGSELMLVIPHRALSELARVLPSDGDSLVEIAATAKRNQVLFRCGDTELISRLIEGQFPDYQRIIPRDAPTRVVVSGADLLRATRVARLFIPDSTPYVRLEVKPSGNGADEQSLVPGQVTVTSSSAEMGDNQSVLDASVEGEEQRVAFNAHYLRDALDSLDTAEVRLDITGPTGPGVLRPVGGPGDKYLHVIMPMHVT